MRQTASKEKCTKKNGRKTRTEERDWKNRTVNGIVTEYTITFIGQTGSPDFFKHKYMEYGYLGLIWLILQTSEADYCDQVKNLLVA